MDHLINRNQQDFYYSSINNLKGIDEQLSVIINDDCLDAFFEKCGECVGDKINQVIVVAENVDKFYSKYENSNVFLVTAISEKDAIEIAINSSKISPKVLIISNNESSSYYLETLSDYKEAWNK